jgi:hypothetical protein
MDQNSGLPTSDRDTDKDTDIDTDLETGTETSWTQIADRDMDIFKVMVKKQTQTRTRPGDAAEIRPWT